MAVIELTKGDDTKVFPLGYCIQSRLKSEGYSILDDKEATVRATVWTLNGERVQAPFESYELPVRDLIKDNPDLIEIANEDPSELVGNSVFEFCLCYELFRQLVKIEEFYGYQWNVYEAR